MTLIRANQLDTSPPEYTVDAMLPDLGIGWGYGSSYTGKSLTLGVELCLAIANGAPFFGHETVQGSTAWCLGEGVTDAGVRIKARLVREQGDRLAQARQIALSDSQDAADAWLASQPPYTDDRMLVKIGAFQVPFTSGKEPTMELRQAAGELGLIDDLRLIVLDTGQNFSSLSLSNDTTANRFMLGMSWLASQLQCTVMGIAHPVSKGGQQVGLPGIRLFGGSDFVWRIQAGEDSTDDAPNALIIAEKVKSGPLFRPMAYGVEKIQWKQPPTDPETGEDIPGVPLITVGSATVRQLVTETAPALTLTAPGTPARISPLPVPEPVPPSRPRRRNGIKPAPAFRAVHLATPAVPVTTPEPAQSTPGYATLQPGTPDPEDADRAKLVTALVSVPCPVLVCKAAPGESCAPGGTAVDYVVLGKMPLMIAHVDRLGTAVAAGKANLDDVLAQFDASPASAEMAGASS